MIRPARIDDFDAIKYIEDRLTIDTNKIEDRDYRSNMERNGFLVQNTLNPQKYSEDIKNIFLVTEINGKIVGHLRIDRANSIEKDRGGIIYRPDLLETAIEKPFKYLDRISLLPEYRGIKLAHSMLREAEKILISQSVAYLYSYVVISPITNTASIIFHDYNGFERVDCSNTVSFAGFTNYQSFKYCKQLIK